MCTNHDALLGVDISGNCTKQKEKEEEEKKKKKKKKKRKRKRKKKNELRFAEFIGDF